MNVHQYARALGRRGGLARARSLSPQQRKKIASLGGKAKAMSRHAVRRIEDNFRFLEAIKALRQLARFFRTASEADLLRLEQNLSIDRRSASDAQDLDFLRRLIKPDK